MNWASLLITVFHPGDHKLFRIPRVNFRSIFDDLLTVRTIYNSQKVFLKLIDALIQSMDILVSLFNLIKLHEAVLGT